MIKLCIQKFIIAFILLLLASFFLRTKVHAAIVEKNTSRTYTLQDDYISVSETKETKIINPEFQVPLGGIEAFTIFNPVQNDPKAEEKKQKTLESIEVFDRNGTKLEYTTEQTGTKNLIVKVNFPNVINIDNSERITLKYKSYGLVFRGGAVTDVYVPGFPEDYKLEDSESSESINTRLIIPAKYKEINFISPNVVIKNDDQGNRLLDIQFENLRGKTTWVQLGTSQYFKFEFTQIAPKSSKIPFVSNVLKMPIPRDIVSGPVTQKVFYTNITPTPVSIKEDGDNNLIASFRVPANKNTEIKIEGYAVLKQDKNFDITKSGEMKSLSEEIISKYTKSSKFWEVDSSEIQKVAGDFAEEEDIYKRTSSTFAYVVDLIDYSFVKKYGINERQGALATLKGGAAVCMEYSDLFITLMRAQGVPARAAFGYAYSSLDYESLNEQSINHQWAEVYYPEQETWVNVDTTWGEFGSQVIGGDLNHFYSHVASIDPETPSTTQYSYFGNVESIPDRDMKIGVQENIDQDTLSSANSQEEVLKKYAEKSNFENLVRSVTSSLENTVSSASSILTDKLGINNKILKAAISMVICFLPLVIVGLLIYTIKRVRLRKKTKS